MVRPFLMRLRKSKDKEYILVHKYGSNMEKRRKDQIIAQILILCREGANKTMIVYQVNLNFRTVMTYLDLLLKKDLLEVIPGNPIIYKTTAEGEIALESLKAVEAVFS